MKKYFYTVATVAITELIIATSAANATFIADNYIGNTDGTYNTSDHVDTADTNYNISGMEVVNNGSTLTVKIIASADYFSDLTNSTPNVYGPGTLLISNTGWNSNGSTTWNYAITLDNSGSTSLYNIGTSGTRNYDTDYELYYSETTDGKIYYGDVRNKEYAWFKPSPSATAISSVPNGWSLTALSLTITMTLPDKIWNGITPLGLHWTMTCANDVIEGQYSPVPEPTTALLLGTGLVGLAGVARRRKS